MGAALLAESSPRFAVDAWRLANGLRVLVQTDRRWPLIASVMSCDAGSRYDPPSRSGLAHVCEHLAFQGSRSAPRLAFPRRIERAGGSAQAVTTPDRICFTSVFPRSELATVLAVEAERMGGASEPPSAATLEIERRVLLEELQQRSQARVRAAAFERIHRLLFPEGDGYHRPPAGDADGIRAIGPEDVRTFVAAHVVPRRAVLALAGDVTAADAARLAERYFGALPPGGGSADAASAGAARQDPSTLRVPAGLADVQAHVAWAVPGFGQAGWYVASILLRGLVAGRPSALAREMTRMGLAQETGGRLITMRDTSTLVLLAAAARDVDCARLEQGLADAIDRLLATGLSAAALERARKKALRDHYLAVQKLDRRADLCASLTSFLDTPERLDDEPRRYASVDERTVAAFASELRERPARVTLSLVPRAEAA